MSDSTVETFTFQKKVPCADADGQPIKEGSVLQHVTDGDRGVVVDIKRHGDIGTMFDAVGDIHIQKSPGCTRCTNNYASWRHVPHNDQTYGERLLSWKMRLYEHDDDRGTSEDEGLAIDGIMALLPDDTVNWESGPWPDRLEDALYFLARHMRQLSKIVPTNTEQVQP